MWDLWWQSGAGAGILRVLRFPLPNFIPPMSQESFSPIIRGWYNRPVVAAVPKSSTAQIKKENRERVTRNEENHDFFFGLVGEESN
jgi:hypothetical protein